MFTKTTGDEDCGSMATGDEECGSRATSRCEVKSPESAFLLGQQRTLQAPSSSRPPRSVSKIGGFEPGNMNVISAFNAFSDFKGGSIAADEVSEATLLSFCQDFFVALFTVCLGATDALSLGSLFFPSSDEFPNEEYRNLGMSLGLLTSFAANTVLARFSQMPFSVGGMLVPTVPVMQAYFEAKIGAEDAQTIIVLIPLITILFGVAVVILGRLKLGSVVEHCPFPVYAGFIAGCGVQLIECAVGIMCPNFEKFAEFESWQALAPKETLIQVSIGTIGAFLCFSIPRLETERRSGFMGLVQDWKVVLVICMVIECAVVYAYAMHYEGMTVDEARDKGWFFKTSSEPALRMPTCVWKKEWFWSFKRGTVKWHKLWCYETMIAYLQVVTLGFLMVTKNLYGLAAMSKHNIDIDKEITNNGYVSIVSGCLGATPGTTVICYSLTAQKLGAGRYFKFFIVLWSAAFFCCGEYIVAYVPKVVPASILVWLGLLLSTPFVWDLMNRTPEMEYGVIVTMVLIDIFMGTGFMLVAGLSLTLIQTTSTVIQTKCFKTHTLEEVRSNVLRPMPDQIYLRYQGNRTLVVRIESGYIAFWAVGQIRKEIERWCAETSWEMVDHVVIDMELVSAVSIGAFSYFKDLVDSARFHGFHLILVVPEEIEPTIVKQMCGFEAYQHAGRFIHALCRGHNENEQFGRLAPSKTKLKGRVEARTKLGTKASIGDIRLEVETVDRFSADQLVLVGTKGQGELHVLKEVKAGSLVLTTALHKDHIVGTAIEACAQTNGWKDGLRAGDISHFMLDARTSINGDEGGAILARDAMTALELCENSILHAREGRQKSSAQISVERFFTSWHRSSTRLLEGIEEIGDTSSNDPSSVSAKVPETKRPPSGPMFRALAAICSKETTKGELTGPMRHDDGTFEGTKVCTSSEHEHGITCVIKCVEFVLADRDSEKPFKGDIEEAVQKLAGFLEVAKYLEDDIIYRGTDVMCNHGGPIPNIYWLIDGELVHTFGKKTKRNMEKARFLRKKEKQESENCDSYQCIGPLSTLRSFRAAAVHVGLLEATCPSTVVQLSHQNYVKLLQSHPLAAHAFNCYLQRCKNRLMLRRPYKTQIPW